MGQSDVLRILEANKDRWLTTNEIADHLDYGRSTVGRNCACVRKSGFAHHKKIHMRKSGRMDDAYKFNGTVW